MESSELVFVDCGNCGGFELNTTQKWMTGPRAPDSKKLNLKEIVLGLQDLPEMGEVLVRRGYTFP